MIGQRMPNMADTADRDSLRAAIYGRTSFSNKGYGHSLNQQIEQGIKRCEALGWTIKFIFEDEAESGKDKNRPEFQKLLHAAERQFIDVIVFWRLDRFSRSLIHAVELEEQLREHDVYLHSLTEQIDTTSPTGRFNFRNIANAAEYERELIRQRSNMTLDSLTSELKWPNGNPPLGFNLGENGRLQIDDDEKELVITIFEKYLNLKSMPKVAHELNDENIPAPEGGNWTGSSVGDVLRNKIYVGLYDVGGVSERITEYQIIDTDTFEEVTKIRHRFNEPHASLRKMEISRKSKIANKIVRQYKEFLGSS